MDNPTDVLNRIANLEKRMSLLENTAKRGTDLGVNGKKESIKEFIISKKPSNDVQKTLAIAFYVEQYEGLQSFNVDDLGNGFRLAKEPVPQNLNDKVNMNIRKGHLMESKEKKDNKKAFTLTNSGEKYVENNFSEK